MFTLAYFGIGNFWEKDGLALKGTDLRTRVVRQIISPKHDVYAPRGKLRKCSQHADLQNTDATYGVLMWRDGDFV